MPDLEPDAIYPETAALPETANAITLLIDGARVYVRRPETPGAVLDVQPLIEALQLALASGEEAREHVTIYVAEDDYERERELLEGMREFTASLQLKLLPDGPLPLLAANIVQHAGVNLMQGPYQSKRKLNVSFAPWRYAAVLAGLFIAAHLGLKTLAVLPLSQPGSAPRCADRRGVPAAHARCSVARRFECSASGRSPPEPVARQRSGGRYDDELAALGEAIEQDARHNDREHRVRQQHDQPARRGAVADALDRIRQSRASTAWRPSSSRTTRATSKREGRLQFKNPGA